LGKMTDKKNQKSLSIELRRRAKQLLEKQKNKTKMGAGLHIQIPTAIRKMLVNRRKGKPRQEGHLLRKGKGQYGVNNPQQRQWDFRVKGRKICTSIICKNRRKRGDAKKITGTEPK